MRLMQEEQPGWVLLGCQAHAFALLIKDLQSEKTVRNAWSKRVYATALMMSNVIHGAEGVRAELRAIQTNIYPDGVRDVATHCPTRFAILHMICKDLLRSEQALVQLVSSRDWAKASKDCTNADVFVAAATLVPARGRAPAFRFFSEAALLVVLVQPIADAIHQLEADKPLLSQMRPIWARLLAHAAAFDSNPDHAHVPPMLPLFQRRFEEHRVKEWPTAYLLDPINAVEDDGEWFLPWGALSALEQAAVKKCLLRMAGVAQAAAVEAEVTQLSLSALPDSMSAHLPVLTKRTPVPATATTPARQQIAATGMHTQGGGSR